MRIKTSRLGGLGMLPLVALLSLTGNSEVLAAPTEDTLTALGTVDDHLTAAMPYQNKARELEAEAVQFETAASKLAPYMDPEGVRRAALTAAAQEKRSDAQEMRELYVAHVRQATALLGKVQPQ